MASLDLHAFVKFINFVGIKNEYEALILLKVGEFFPIETNCSVPKLNLFPEVGLVELFKLFLDALAITLTNVFSSGHEPSFGVNPIPVSYTHLTLPTIYSV